MSKSWFIVIVTSLTAGLITGYMLWGKNAEDKLDAKQLLNRAIQEVEIIESRNKDLENQLKNIQDNSKEAERLSKENISMQTRLKKTEQDNTQLRNLLAQVQDELSKAKENIHVQEELRTISNDLKARISGLEKENGDLRNILQKIGSLTEDQQLNTPKEIQSPDMDDSGSNQQ